MCFIKCNTHRITGRLKKAKSVVFKNFRVFDCQQMFFISIKCKYSVQIGFVFFLLLVLYKLLFLFKKLHAVVNCKKNENQ